MNESSTSGPAARKRSALAVTAVVVLILLAVAASLYLNSASFKERVRLKVVAELELITGGRVEIEYFGWNLAHLQFNVHNLTIHGLEAASEAPYAHIDTLSVRLKILYIFRRDIGLRSVIADKVVIHLIVYPDGTTNQPTPKIKTLAHRSSAERLFDLTINHLEVHESQLLWNDKRIPLDFGVENLTADMSYMALRKQYEGKILVGKFDSDFKGYSLLPGTAEVSFGLGLKQSEIKSLKWVSGRSIFQASGQIRNYKDPIIELTYKAFLDLPQLGSSFHRPQLRSGMLHLEGSGSYQAPGFSSTGSADFKNIDWRGQSLVLVLPEGGAQFRIDHANLDLKNLVLRTLGGSITGDAEIANWMSVAAAKNATGIIPAGGNAASGGRNPVTGQQRGVAHLRLNSLQLASLAASVVKTGSAASRIHPAGTASGTAIVTWAGALADSSVNLRAQIKPPAHPGPGQLPVEGQVQATYLVARQILNVAQMNLATPTASLEASGVMGSPTSRLNVVFSATSLDEIGPIVSSSLASYRVPVELQGRAAFNGWVSGRFDSPEVHGHVDFGSFDSFVNFSVPPENPSGGAKPPVRRVHWDSAVADIDYSLDTISTKAAVFRRGKSQVAVEGSARLHQGNFSRNSPFSLHAVVSDADLGDLQSIVGGNYPMTGTFNLIANVSGTMLESHGSGKLELKQATLFAEPFNAIRSDIQFAGGEVQLNHLVLLHEAGQINGNAGYSPASKAFRFTVEGGNFDLGKVRSLQLERLTVAGKANFSANGSGTRAQPVINGRARFTNLVVNGEQVGDVTADAVTSGDMLHLKAESQLKAARLAIDGDVKLRGDYPAKVSANYSNLVIDPLLRAFLPGRLKGHTVIAGKLDAAGPLRRWREMDATIRIEQFFGGLQDVNLSNSGPIVIRVVNQVATIEQLHLTGDETNLVGSGTLHLTGARQLNIRADGKVNLKLLQIVNPDLIASGSTTVGVTVGGVLSKPALTGRIQIVGQIQFNNARLALMEIPNTLSDIRGALVFDADRLQVESLTARTGGGLLRLGGFVSYSKGLFFDLNATAQDIRLRYPPGISTTANAGLRWAGTTSSSLLSGSVTVVKFGITPRFDFAQYLSSSRQPPLSSEGSALDNTRLDIQVVSTPELRVESSLAKLSGDADIHVQGTVARPAILGSVDIVEGEVFINGTKYHLHRGDVTFNNPVRIAPVINLEASARVRDYDLTLGFHGSTDKLSTTYRSDPPLPPSDIIALLALGRTRNDTMIEQRPAQSFGDPVSNALLSEATNATVTNRAQKLFGVSRIKIDPQAGGPENNPNARLTIEQQISNNVTLTYITNLSQSAQQVAQVEFNVNRRVSIVAVRDETGVLGFDLRIKTRKK